MKRIKASNNLITTLSILTSLLTGCGAAGEGDDTQEAGTTASTTSEISSNQADTSNLIPKVDVSCAGKSCLDNEVALALNATQSRNLLNRRYFAKAILGFENGAPGDYEAFHQGDQAIQDVFPEDGLVGRIEGARSHLLDSLQAVQHYAKCSDLPLTSQPIKVATGTIQFAQPQLSPPEHWPTAGVTYDRRILYTTANATAIFEFYCDYNGQMVKLVEPGSAGRPQNTVMFYDGEMRDPVTKQRQPVRHFGLSFYDDHNFDDAMNLAMELEIDEDQGTVKLWQTRSGINAADSAQLVSGYRFTINANYNTGYVSHHSQDLGHGGVTLATLQADPEYDRTDFIGVAPQAGGMESFTGCSANFRQDLNTIADNSWCSGLDLEELPQMTIRADGRMSIRWVQENLKDAIDQIQ